MQLTCQGRTSRRVPSSAESPPVLTQATVLDLCCSPGAPLPPVPATPSSHSPLLTPRNHHHRRASAYTATSGSDTFPTAGLTSLFTRATLQILSYSRPSSITLSKNDIPSQSSYPILAFFPGFNYLTIRICCIALSAIRR